MAVEATWPKQGRVQRLCVVRCGDDDHAAVLAESVELGEQLVETHARLGVVEVVSFASDRVDLVDENNGRLHFFRLGEQFAHALRSNTYKHLFEVGSGCAEERHTSLAGNSAREESFA